MGKHQGKGSCYIHEPDEQTAIKTKRTDNAVRSSLGGI